MLLPLPPDVAADAAAAADASAVAVLPLAVAVGVWAPGVPFGEPFSLRGDRSI